MDIISMAYAKKIGSGLQYNDTQVKQMINNLNYRKQEKTDVTLDTTDKTVVGGGSKSGMVAVDGNTGGIKYYGGEMNIFTTISYPVAEQ